MFKNILIGVYTLLLVLVIIAIATDRLVWVSEDIDTLQKAIEMHKPEVLKMDGNEILYVPTSSMRGSSWKVDNKFYIYDEGELKRIDLPSKK